MNCPNCGTTFSIVTHTNQDAGPTVSRQRKCLSCGLHFHTVESYAGDVAGVAHQAALFRDLISDHSRQKAREVARQMMAKEAS